MEWTKTKIPVRACNTLDNITCANPFTNVKLF